MRTSPKYIRIISTGSSRVCFASPRESPGFMCWSWFEGQLFFFNFCIADQHYGAITTTDPNLVVIELHCCAPGPPTVMWPEWEKFMNFPRQAGKRTSTKSTHTQISDVLLLSFSRWPLSFSSCTFLYDAAFKVREKNHPRLKPTQVFTTTFISRRHSSRLLVTSLKQSKAMRPDLRAEGCILRRCRRERRTASSFCCCCCRRRRCDLALMAPQRPRVLRYRTKWNSPGRPRLGPRLSCQLMWWINFTLETKHNQDISWELYNK